MIYCIFTQSQTGIFCFFNTCTETGLTLDKLATRGQPQRDIFWPLSLDSERNSGWNLSHGSRYHVTASLCRHVLVSWPVSLYWAPPGAGVAPHMCRATHQQPPSGGWVRKFNTKDAAYFHGNKSREESGWWILLTEVLRPLSNTCCAAAACSPGPGRRGKAVERVQCRV